MFPPRTKSRHCWPADNTVVSFACTLPLSVVIFFSVLSNELFDLSVCILFVFQVLSKLSVYLIPKADTVGQRINTVVSVDCILLLCYHNELFNWPVCILFCVSIVVKILCVSSS